MANRPALVPQVESARFMKAAKSAGFSKVRIVTYPDGRIERIAEAVDGEAKTIALQPADADDMDLDAELAAFEVKHGQA